MSVTEPSSINWQWAIPIAITLGMAAIGGIWALVGVVAKLVARATAMEVKLDIVVPVAQKVPIVEQNLAVTIARVDEHEGEINGLREKVHEDANELARVSGLVANGGRRH